MSSTRKLSSRLTQLLELFNRNDDWLIVINADPDAMASAMALKRIMSHRTGKVTIAAFLLGGLPTQEVINNFIFVTLGNIFGGTILFALPLQIVTKRK